MKKRNLVLLSIKRFSPICRCLALFVSLLSFNIILFLDHIVYRKGKNKILFFFTHTLHLLMVPSVVNSYYFFLCTTIMLLNSWDNCYAPWKWRCTIANCEIHYNSSLSKVLNCCSSKVNFYWVTESTTNTILLKLFWRCF